MGNGQWGVGSRESAVGSRQSAIGKSANRETANVKRETPPLCNSKSWVSCETCNLKPVTCYPGWYATITVPCVAHLCVRMAIQPNKEKGVQVSDTTKVQQTSVRWYPITGNRQS
jgi:hypothetical protein